MPQTPSAPLDSGRLYILDAHGLIFQMYHAIGGMTAPDGRATNAVFGVTRALMDLRDRGADYLLAAWDHPGPTFRDALSADYKAHREPPPPDLLLQEPLVRQMLEAMRVPVLAYPGYEADDVIATVASRAAERGLEVFIGSADKDCRQLLSPRIKILNLRKNEIIDEARLWEEWGVRPEQVVDFQALVGDSVDNVPGVPGVGPKTAAKWLQEWGSLDALIAHVDEIGGGKSSKVKDALKEAIANGRLQLSRQLVTLDRNVPIPLDWEGWRRQDWDAPRLLGLFQELGFRGFAAKVRSWLKNHSVSSPSPSAGQGSAATSGASTAIPASADPLTASTPPQTPQPSSDHPAPGKRSGSTRPQRASFNLFSQLGEQPEGEPAADRTPDEPNASATASTETFRDDWSYDGYRLVDTPQAFASFLAELQQQRLFAIDAETTGLDPLQSEIVGLAFAWKPGEAYYLPLRCPPEDPCLPETEVFSALAPILADPAVAKVNQNIKFDLLVLRRHGLTLQGIRGDSMIAHYLLNAGARSHNLDEIVREYLHHENIPITALIGKKGRGQLSMAQVRTELLRRYAGEDADTALRLREILERQLEEEGLRNVYDTLEIPLIEVLADLEYTGVRLNLDYLGQLSREMEAQLREIEHAIHQLAGREFNVASPRQLREVLFDDLRLRVQKRTGTTGEASTDQETLEKLAAQGHEIPKRVLEHRHIAKLKGTYVDALPALVNPATGRVHTSFNQTVAATGRLSSSDPNLQNIPARTDLGRQIRRAFIPHDGWLMLTADYSQIELRLLAHLSGDEGLREAFAQDRDIHASVAARIFKVPEEQVTSEQRRLAKTVNFGVIYGMSAFGLSLRLGMPRGEAQRFIDDYFARFPQVLAYQEKLLQQARERGYVSTLAGRRRRFQLAEADVQSGYRSRTQAAREAINMEIQGSAADLIKQAMLRVHHRLHQEHRQTRMLLTVHDELVFETPPEEVDAVARLIREEMSDAMRLSVPLKVDIAVGPNWLDVEDL